APRCPVPASSRPAPFLRSCCHVLSLRLLPPLAVSTQAGQPPLQPRHERLVIGPRVQRVRQRVQVGACVEVPARMVVCHPTISSHLFSVTPAAASQTAS